jgi:Predicted transcriptional regulators
MLVESTISTGKAAKLLGVSVKTLQRWEREGRLIPVARTDSNRCLAALNLKLNLKRLATETALPVASPTSNGGAAAGMAPAVVGEVTPVRYDDGQQNTSGQEENCAHFCAHS